MSLIDRCYLPKALITRPIAQIAPKLFRRKPRGSRLASGRRPKYLIYRYYDLQTSEVGVVFVVI